MSFAAPLFLAGIALLAAPWLIHRIRRPEREEVRFSSLLFVPNVKKEVIERRRIQHILLMLLRMLLLLLLAFAFSHPFVSTRERSQAPVEISAVRHLILLDVSYSMGLDGSFDRARDKAREVLNSLPAGESVALATFAEQQRVLAGFDQSSELVRQAVDQAELTHYATNYPAALQFAETQLTSVSQDTEDTRERRIVHLISDYQRAGLSADYDGWRLSSMIELEHHPVREERGQNLSLSDVGLRVIEGAGVLVAVKVKNWADTDQLEMPVRLFVDDALVEESTLDLNAGAASQVSFEVTRSDDFSGYLEVGDAGGLDDRRYFVWRAPRKLDLLIVADPQPDQRYPASLFMETAAGEVWSRRAVTQADMTQALETRRPDLVMLADLNGFRAADALRTYLTEGGSALLTLGPGVSAQDLAPLLIDTGVSAQGPLYPETLPNRYQILGRIDYAHPVFAPFDSARFNDFSQVRFFNVHRFETGADVRVPARFEAAGEGEGAPAILDLNIGEGRLIVWAFEPRLDWTNLAKRIKFLPLVHETLATLGGREEALRTFNVGERYDLARWQDVTAVRTPDGAERPAQGNHYLSQAGFLAVGEGENWRVVDAVNLAADEADPEVVDPKEFALKLTAGAVLAERDDDMAVDETISERRVDYDHPFLIALAVFALFETWYAARLSRRNT